MTTTRQHSELTSIAYALTQQYGAAIPDEWVVTLHNAMRDLAPDDPEAQVLGVAMIDRGFEGSIAEAQAVVDAAQRGLREVQAERGIFRAFIRDTMVAKELKKVVSKLLTISLVAGRESMEVTDLDAVADEFSEMKKVASKRKAKASIELSGGVVPAGFEIKRGAPHITIRTK